VEITDLHEFSNYSITVTVSTFNGSIKEYSNIIFATLSACTYKKKCMPVDGLEVEDMPYMTTAPVN